MRAGPTRHNPEIHRDDTAATLLAWYDHHRRDLPWRAPPGVPADPYHVWLSEIMLQQTTVVVVKPYFERFLAIWPTVSDLASAPLDAVLSAWAGLGYYARARNLHRCAQIVAGDFDGRFPETENELMDLPGIGRYTAAAIAAIAFGRPAVVVDGNVERVMARLFAIEDPLPDSKQKLRECAASLSPVQRPGDYAQAVMDLGATICTPRKANCPSCPWVPFCAGLRAGIADTLPGKRAKAARPTRRGIVFWVERADGAVLLRDRPDKGLLGGMAEIPSTPWTDIVGPTGDPMVHAPVETTWRRRAGVVRHTFTHFHLELEVWLSLVPENQPLAEAADPARCRWVAAADLAGDALPSVMRKVVAHAAARDQV